MTSLAWGNVRDWSVVAGADLELGVLVADGVPGPPDDRRHARGQRDPPGRPALRLRRALDRWSRCTCRPSAASSSRWRLGAGLRAEWVTYEYDNRMLDGNTDDHGVPCTPSGLPLQPAGRPHRSLLRLDAEARAVARHHARARRVRERDAGIPPAGNDGALPAAAHAAGRGPRARGARLARTRAQGLVATGRFRAGRCSTWTSSGVILRESNGFYVANGRTTHRGVEYDLRWRPLPSLEFAAAGTYARHRYDFSRQVDGGETIEAGNDMDTAPREIGRYGILWRPRGAVEVEAEWMMVGDYWLDAANEHRYSGYGLLNLRGLWRLAPRWTTAAARSRTRSTFATPTAPTMRSAPIAISRAGRARCSRRSPGPCSSRRRALAGEAGPGRLRRPDATPPSAAAPPRTSAGTPRATPPRRR